MSGEKKHLEEVNWNIQEVVLSPDGKTIKSISGDMELTRNKLRAFIDKEKFSGRSGARSKEAIISLIVSHSKTARVYKDMYKTDVTPTKSNVQVTKSHVQVKSKKKSKVLVPKFVTKIGTLYRYIMCKMDERALPDALALNSALSREQVVSRERSPFYSTIAKFIMIQRYRSFFSLGLNFSNRAYFDAQGINDKSMRNYDKDLTPEEAYEIDGYINNWYSILSTFVLSPLFFL